MGIKPGASCDDCRISGCDCSNARKLSGANLPYYGREDFNIFAPLPLNSVTKLERALAQRAGPEPSFRPAAVSLSLTGPGSSWGLLLLSRLESAPH
jgi:hypothetical protein